MKNISNGKRILDAPRDFCLYRPHSYAKTQRFLNQIKEEAIEKEKPVIINFEKTRFMSAAAALRLAAMVTYCQNCSLAPDKENIITTKLPKGNYKEKLFLTSKLWDIIKPGNSDKLDRVWNDRENPFKTGNNPSAQFAEFLTWMQQIGLSPPRLSAAIQEAYLNVHQHAYSADASFPSFLQKRWWQYSYVRYNEKILHFLLLDFGVGIPQKVQQTENNQLLDHDRAIMKAMQPGWSSTGKKGRGRGSLNLQEPIKIDITEPNALMIMSGKGRYSFNSKGQSTIEKLPIDFGGTLVEWTIKVDEEHDD